jgi:hypothetical protein
MVTLKSAHAHVITVMAAAKLSRWRTNNDLL